MTRTGRIAGIAWGVAAAVIALVRASYGYPLDALDYKLFTDRGFEYDEQEGWSSKTGGTPTQQDLKALWSDKLLANRREDGTGKSMQQYLDKLLEEMGSEEALVSAGAPVERPGGKKSVPMDLVRKPKEPESRRTTGSAVRASAIMRQGASTLREQR